MNPKGHQRPKADPKHVHKVKAPETITQPPAEVSTPPTGTPQVPSLAHTLIGNPLWSSTPKKDIDPVNTQGNTPLYHDSCPTEIDISLGVSGHLPNESPEDLLFPELQGLLQELGDTEHLEPELSKYSCPLHPYSNYQAAYYTRTHTNIYKQGRNSST